ncbi:MAG: copper-translocating P-type ATPase [Methanomicrobium sp.]|nr:copper-translocating P-type ATPase [Methanomicrobium sp.]
MFAGIVPAELSRYVMFVIATPTVLYLGYPIFKSAFAGLRTGSLNMDFMYALGIGVSYIASVLGTFNIFLSGEFIFYETSVMLASFLMLGRFLESGAKRRTNDAVKKLIALKPKTALLKGDGDEYTTVPADSLKSGDIVLIKPGSIVPADAVIVSGDMYADQSSVTGEPMPVKKTVGDGVIGGTINTGGAAVVRVTKAGSESLLSQIIRLVEETQRQKPHVQRIADTAVSYFIPAVLLIATVSACVWYFLLNATPLFAATVFISVVVVACPCALGLATPTAVAVGIGRGAELGILIKNGEVIEDADKIRCIAFDKTGTLTVGKPKVTKIIPFADGDANAALALAAGIEAMSEHPIARAVSDEAGRVGVKVPQVADFRSHAGRGASGAVDGRGYAIGNAAFVGSFGVAVPDDVIAELKKYESDGSTTVILAQTDLTDSGTSGAGGKVIAGIVISDVIKPDAKETIAAVKADGYAAALITGDGEGAATAVASALGIEEKNVSFGVLPTDKASAVDKYQKSYGKVLFAGDGINDAPAMAKADIALAVSNGTEIALDSADVVLMNDRVSDIRGFLLLSKKIMGRIRLNLFWAFFYNICLIPVAAGILYPFFGIIFRPEFSGAAMILSSITVISLSLNLRKFNPGKCNNSENSVKKETRAE